MARKIGSCAWDGWCGAIVGVGRGSRMRVHDAFFFFFFFFFPSFPLMTEAFQPSERGSLVETNKNWSGKLAKSLGSLKSAGGERRWELQGGGERWPCGSLRKEKNPALDLLCASEAFPPLHPSGVQATGSHLLPESPRVSPGAGGSSQAPSTPWRSDGCWVSGAPSAPS